MNEEPVISLKYGREVQVMKSIYHCILHSNSLSNEMDKSLLDVRGLPIIYCSSDELGVPNFLSRYRTSVC